MDKRLTNKGNVISNKKLALSKTIQTATAIDYLYWAETSLELQNYEEAIDHLERSIALINKLKKFQNENN